MSAARAGDVEVREEQQRDDSSTTFDTDEVI